MSKALVWLRRNLRIEDNKVIKEALLNSEKLYFCFVFDFNILKNFPNKNDRRLSFIASALEMIDLELKKHGGSLVILYGDPKIEIVKLAKSLQINSIFADLDFEPYSKERDQGVKQVLNREYIDFKLVLDHLLISPSKILKQDSTPYRVFTPYMRNFYPYLDKDHYRSFEYDLRKRLVQNTLSFNKAEILEQAGYNYNKDELWDVKEANYLLEEFIKNKLSNYSHNRNYLAEESTSKLSPYLRFGIISIRKCFRLAFENDFANQWVIELIWREFYAYILYHFPASMRLEFQGKYIGKINWSNKEEHFEAFCNAQTGFPLIDSAVRELLTTGWMHNRARMVVASFFTKNLFLDWRKGEQFFSQHLMDYELAANVGGWQWSASTGTDAQPYFRIFNPIEQGRKYDPEGKYIRKYLPEIRDVATKDIFDGEIIAAKYNLNYPRPIVDYKSTRQYAISFFKSL